MTTALQLLKSYLDNVRDPIAASALFAEDGVLELPTIKVHAQGHAAIQGLISGLLKQVPDFRFKDLKVWIDTPDKAFGEYSVEAVVSSTGKLYKQTYAGVLLAEGGKIKLLREALDTAAAARAFAKD
ncbi:Ketosteroid isomerase-related protein [Roseateles sp. YR242]|uniref:nuclear transport factor 2 family protein n=1 Tax=Roseateles sp. YR242 TaxID=1855305 RepID=UPI0008B0110B|nr:nuclear transport factor 2 family protein [Roseateles sp. YR242]SEK62966.1 Ketosteroid isomerase-related protein [Roseateles sp. YR242]